jgi:hypothetical protein
MKSTILSFFILLILAASCAEDGPGFVPEIKISDSDTLLTFKAMSDAKPISIETNLEELNVESSENWCKASYDNNQLRLFIEANTDYKERTCEVRIYSNSISKSIKVFQLGENPTIKLTPKNKILDHRGGDFKVKVITNLDLNVITNNWIKQKQSQNSKKTKVEETYTFTAQTTQSIRKGFIIFKQTDGEYVDTLFVYQNITNGDYQPDETITFEKDNKLKINSVKLTPSDKYHPGSEITKVIDGNIETGFHSPWGGIPQDMSLEMEFELEASSAKIANYVLLHPRLSGPNGVIKKAKLYVTTKDNPNYVEVANINAPMLNKAVKIEFKTPIINPRKFKLIAIDGYNDGYGTKFISLNEFEVYESKSISSLGNDVNIFTDFSCSALKPGTSLSNIQDMKNDFLKNIATYLHLNKYDTCFRIQEYAAYRPVYELSNELKTSNFNYFENPTGIYFEANQEVVVFVGETNGETISLKIKDFSVDNGVEKDYPLSEGVNTISIKNKGNGYINYYTRNYKTAKDITVHIASASVTGYFDINKHDNINGSEILEKAVSPIIDIKGNYVNLIYLVSDMKLHSKQNMYDLIKVYDNVILEEYKMMGLDKFNRMPKNHLLGRVMWSNYMHADGLGAAFNTSTMAGIGKASVVKNNLWGISHEFGHVLQTRPGFKWNGTTEVTNNIFSVWNDYLFNENGYNRLEDESGGAKFRGFHKEAIVNKKNWGKLGDVFADLVPLWQLQLYYHLAGEGNSWHKPYCYADVFEKVRVTDESGFNNGELQLNFIKYCCDAVQEDLTHFFETIGMLKEIDADIDDYQKDHRTITIKMIEDVKSYCSKYSKPATDYIHYISANSYKTYKNKRAVEGTYNKGISGETKKIIKHLNWKNVTVYETYNGQNLTNVTIYGAGGNKKIETVVPYPYGSTRIEAVAWDGTKTLVFGNR